MHQFKTLELTEGTDPCTGLPVFGFNHNDFFIFDPFSSTCSRFKVDSEEAYGVSHEDAQALVALNKLLDEATQAALNELTLKVQKAFGITSGDSAAMYYSDEANVKPIAQAVMQYMLHERQQH